MARSRKTTAELVPASGLPSPAALLAEKRESLAAWFTLYVELEAGANSADRHPDTHAGKKWVWWSTGCYDNIL